MTQHVARKTLVAPSCTRHILSNVHVALWSGQSSSSLHTRHPRSIFILHGLVECGAFEANFRTYPFRVWWIDLLITYAALLMTRRTVVVVSTAYGLSSSRP
ncbi:hypothetical protein CALVIDRAFT_391428 [Calocera viscosa TUFC12733]|uniref:Uncharacterized protein n=1 Tax=Calocera viscosa (strain TUFC12733) TaxID=1330018 RepID=A0A167GEU7_CALVF|nr:hypothetical protein CALVIDRAFT_391428 [Calocera viscosa TUFC12733]